MSGRTCETCRHWDAEPGYVQITGLCRNVVAYDDFTEYWQHCQHHSPVKESLTTEPSGNSGELEGAK